MFIGRDSQLSVLEELHDSRRPELFVLYGRRRVGKTELLQKFCQGRRAVCFQAAQVRERDNLRAFRDALAEGLGGDALLEGIEFPDWSTALSFAAERAGDQRLVVVLDEFPYLCESSKGLTSQLQRFWDTRGKNSELMLILCGSQMSFMEDEVLAEKSPLFGRRTGQRRLEPLEPIETLAFYPEWSADDRVLAYAILGGMPAYLRRFDDKRSLRANVEREILRPEGFLFEEVQFLLRTELSSPATYNSILAAVARGADRVGDIALQVGVDSTTAGKYLHVLRELHLVEREIPVTDPNPLRSRRGRYRIRDRFLTFHFRHLQPHLSLVHAGRGARVWDEFVAADIPRLMEEARLDFVLAHLAREASELVGEEVIEVGRHPGGQVSAVARTADGGSIAALTPGKLGASGLATLSEDLAALEGAFGRPPAILTYRLTGKPERPLAVQRVAAEELGTASSVPGGRETS